MTGELNKYDNYFIDPMIHDRLIAGLTIVKIYTYGRFCMNQAWIKHKIGQYELRIK